MYVCSYTGCELKLNTLSTQFPVANPQHCENVWYCVNCTYNCTSHCVVVEVWYAAVQIKYTNISKSGCACTGVYPSMLFFVDTGCATRSGQRFPTGSIGRPFSDRMPTRTPVEQFGIGRQPVQNIGKLRDHTSNCLFTGISKNKFLGICVRLCKGFLLICVCCALT